MEKRSGRLAQSENCIPRVKVKKRQKKIANLEPQDCANTENKTCFGEGGNVEVKRLASPRRWNFEASNNGAAVVSHCGLAGSPWPMNILQWAVQWGPRLSTTSINLGDYIVAKTSFNSI